MALKSILVATWNNKDFLLHCMVILTLVSVTIWDSSVIIQSFVSDNRMTVVSTETGRISPPYVENVTIMADYHDSILPKDWLRELNITTHFSQSSYHQKTFGELVSGRLLLASINVSTTEGKARAIAVLGMVSKMDEEIGGYGCLLGGRSACESDRKTYSNLSLLLRNSRELEALEEQLFSEFYDTFVLNTDPSNISITFHYLKYNQVQVEIKFDRIDFRKGTDKRKVRLRLNDNTRFATDADQTQLEGASAMIFSGRTSQERLRFEANKQHLVEHDFKNLGMYNKTNTVECSEDPDLICSMPNHPDCDDRAFLKTILNKCGCIPFIDKKNVPKLRDEISHENLPYCDFQMYYDCSEEVGPIPIDRCLPSCVTIRNYYTIRNTRALQCDDPEDGRCSSVKFEFKLSDHSYVYIEDRMQLTPSQFLSQIGGDIGLYTGLSLLSVWRLIVCIRNRYKRYRSAYARKNPTTSGGGGESVGFVRGFVLHFCKEIAHSIDGFCDGEAAVDEEMPSSGRMNEDKEGGGRMRMEGSIERRIGNLERNNRKVDERLVKMESKLDEIASFIRTASYKRIGY